MLEALSLALFFGLLIFNTIFLIVKKKEIGLIVVQLVVMLFSIIVSVTLVLPSDTTLGIFLAFIVVVEFIANVLQVQVP